MNEELKAIDTIRNHLQVLYMETNTKESVSDELDILENALKNQKRKLDLIGEVLVDASKGNLDLNDAINEIREVLGYE